MRPIVTDVLNTKQNRVLDKELDLIARQDDQEVKHKSLTESEDGLNLNSYIY
jgi:hypothetical protein